MKPPTKLGNACTHLLAFRLLGILKNSIENRDVIDKTIETTISNQFVWGIDSKQSQKVQLPMWFRR